MIDVESAPASMSAMAFTARLVCRARWKQKNAATIATIATTHQGDRSAAPNPPRCTRSVSALRLVSSTP
jgi:hypothetical protein